MLFSVTFVQLLMTSADVPVAAEILVELIEIVIREPADQLFQDGVLFERGGLLKKLELLETIHSGVWRWCVTRVFSHEGSL